MAKQIGTVKWFSDGKGFGFIERSDGDDLFVHHASIEGLGYRTLSEGERVEFDVLDEPTGPKAKNVVRLEPGKAPPLNRPIQSPTDHARR